MARLQDPTLESLARRRAALKLGWLGHALAYVAVNGLLALLAAGGGRAPSRFMLAGWGLGLVLHGVAVFLASGGAGLYRRMLEAERSRLQLERDPW